MVGIVAIQGAFLEHQNKLKQLGVPSKLIKKPADLEGVERCILPGGESTAMSKQMVENGLMQALRNKVNDGMPIMGTCAGLILLAQSIENDSLPTLGLMAIHVQRNAYGRQLGSFTAQALIPEIAEKALKLVFIRAPYIKNCGPDVKVLHVHENRIVAAQERRMLALAFHPELTDDTSFHEYFLHQL